MLIQLPAAPTPGWQRRGVTLAELLVALMLFAIIGATLVNVLARQQRFYTGTSQLIDARRSVRDASDLLAAELRGLSPGVGDIYSMSDTAIDFRAPRGVSVVCEFGGGRNSITVPPLDPTVGVPLTNWLEAPVAGDTVFIYNQARQRLNSPDPWMKYTLSAAPTGAGVCLNSTNLTKNGVDAAKGFTIFLNPSLDSSIAVGAPIRFYRRVRYNLYQAADAKWYLGLSDCVPSRTPQCSTPQAVSGPFLPPGASAGIKFTYADSTGAATAMPSRVARIAVGVQAETQADVRIGGLATGRYRDSLSLDVTVRNRP